MSVDGDVVLPLSKVSAALAALIGVTPGREAAFQARLKQLMRLEFPPGANVGKYAKVSYSAAQLFQLAFALELLQAGLTPKRATGTVITFWDNIRKAILHGLDDQSVVTIAFLPKDFGGLTSEVTESEDDRIAWTSRGVLTFKLRGQNDPDMYSDFAEFLSHPRAVTLNVTAIVRGVAQTIAPTSEFWADVRAWRRDKDKLGRPLGGGRGIDP